MFDTELSEIKTMYSSRISPKDLETATVIAQKCMDQIGSEGFFPANLLITKELLGLVYSKLQEMFKPASKQQDEEEDEEKEWNSR